jgi:hypothetical protein
MKYTFSKEKNFLFISIQLEFSLPTFHANEKKDEQKNPLKSIRKSCFLIILMHPRGEV